MLELSIIVAAGIFAPIDQIFRTSPEFYIACAITECLVAAGAYYLDAGTQLDLGEYEFGAGSLVIILLSILLLLEHFVGMTVGPQPGLGPYRVIVPVLEYAELVSCILFSPGSIELIKRNLL